MPSKKPKKGAVQVPQEVLDANPDPNVMPDITGPGGRGTSYESKFDQMLIDHMAKGLSFESFAGVVSKGTKTIYEWAKANASFQQAKTLGSAKCRLWWEIHGTAYLVEGRSIEVDGPDKVEVINGKEVRTPTKIRVKKTEKLNTNLFRLNMVNRFGWKNSGSEEADGAGTTINIHAQIMEAIRERNKKVGQG